MLRLRYRLLLAAAACACIIGAARPARAGDHLNCYKAREIEGPGRLLRSADLASTLLPPLATAAGCLIKGPSKLVCAPVEKQNVNPPAPGGGPNGPTTVFVCYKVRCPRQLPQGLTVKDQFGTHHFVLDVPRILCAPASPSGAFLDTTVF
jgi:hypothetical protein